MKKITIIILIILSLIIVYSCKATNHDINTYDVLNNDDFKNILRDELELKYPLFLVDDILNNTWDYQVLNNDLLASSYSNIINEDVNIYIDCRKLDNYHLGCKNDNNYQNKNIYELDKNKKTVALTFDDGPGEYTKDIVDLLNKNKANATFFLLGNRLSNKKDTLEYIISNNNELGSHTYNHKVLTRLKNNKLDSEINDTTNKIKELVNYDVKLLRPPYGIVNKRIRDMYNYSYILWSLDTLDWKSKSAKKVYKKVIDNIEDGDIILMHEIYYSSYKALENILPELYLEGYQVTTVSKLAELKGYSLEDYEKYSSFK